jgi:hypothetical protein
MENINQPRQMVARLEARLNACKDVQEELIGKKLILETILNGFSEGIFLLSKYFKIIWANRALLESSEYKAKEVIRS